MKVAGVTYHPGMQPTQLRTLWKERLGVAILLVIFGSLSATAAGAWPWVDRACHWLARWLQSVQAASWAQAFGTVGAIVGTAWVANSQLRKQQEYAKHVEVWERTNRELAATGSLINAAVGLVGGMERIVAELQDLGAASSKASTSWYTRSMFIKLERQFDAFPFDRLEWSLSTTPAELSAAALNFSEILERLPALLSGMTAAAFDAQRRDLVHNLDLAKSAEQRLRARAELMQRLMREERARRKGTTHPAVLAE